MSHEVRWLIGNGDWDAYGESQIVPAAAPGVPRASFSVKISNDTVACDGLASTTTTGTITTWEWDFGDDPGDTAIDPSGEQITHSYAAVGAYVITLTVTNSDGVTNTTSQTVNITYQGHPVDLAPVPKFTSSVSGLSVSVDGSASTDQDGSITDYSWDFGDGTSADRHASVYLGGVGALKAVTGASQNLTAVIDTCSLSQNVLTVSGHGTGTTGTIGTYTWHWGDQTTVGATASSSHTYTAIGTYTVTLTVTDDLGGIATTSQTVNVTSLPTTPPNAVFIWSQNTGASSINTDGRGSNAGSGSSISSYVWNWGDNTTSTGAQSGHTYATYGTYQVTLTVTNNLGATDSQVTTVPVTASVSANKPPTASFTYSATNLRVDVDASGSSDSDGSIVKYFWDFQQSTYTTTSPIAAGYVYNSAGTYTIKLTVTDNAGATATTSKSVTVTAAPAGNTTGNGDQGGKNIVPTGAGIVNYSGLSGGTFSARVNSAGSANQVALPSGTYTFSDFADGGAFGAQITTKGLRGAGSKYTVVQMNPNTSTKKAPTSGTNNYEYVKMDNVQDGTVIDGILFNGTPQTSMPLYNGPQFAHVQGKMTVSNCTFRGFPGNSGSPPGETFGVAVWHQDVASSVIDFTNCTFDGASAGSGSNGGAAASGVNTMSGTINFTDCLFQNSVYSAGLALWEMVSGSTVNLIRPVFQNCHRNLGNEAQGGTINIYDPMFAMPTASGEDDIRITWTQNYNSGRINIYFTAQSNLDAMMNARGGKKLTSQVAAKNATMYGSGNPAYSGPNDPPNFCHIFVAGREVDKTLYWTIPAGK